MSLEGTLIELERQKCAAGFEGAVYFIENFCKLRHPVKGRVPFKMYEYQKKSLKDFIDNRFSVLLKSRQMGYSWLIAAYSLWIAQFQSEADILLMSRRERDAQELLVKIKYMYDFLPKFLQVPKKADQDSKTELGFKNHSKITSLPATEQSGRGGAGTLVVIDEAAFIPWGEDVWSALRPTLSTGGKLVVQSTAPTEGGENLFSRLWHDYKENKFTRCEGTGEISKERHMVHWSDNPERDDQWYEVERPGYTERQWQTEMEGNFEQSIRRVFPKEILKLQKQEWKEGQLGERFCEPPLLYEQYAIGYDPSEGLEKGDFSVAQVIKRSTGKQVAILRTKDPIVNATEKIVDLAMLYNNALLAIEDNSVGAVAVNIAKRKYNNLYKRRTVDRKTDTITEKIGWRSTKRSKPLLIRDLEIALRDGDLILTDEITWREMWQYEYDDKGATNAPRGNYYDDCVMSLGVAWQALKQIPTFEQREKFKGIKQKRKTKMLNRARSKTIGY